MVNDNAGKRQRWRSKISQGYLHRHTLKGQINENTKVVFFIDGFPKQGNTSLRSIILYIFPEVAILDPLTHNSYLMKEAINKKYILLSPIRNPYEAISSAINQANSSIINLNQKDIDHPSIVHHIDLYINLMSFILKNEKSILIIKYEDVLKMCLDFENHDIEKNAIIRYLQDRFDLSLNLQDYTGDIVFKNTSHRSIVIEKRLHLLMYRDKMSEAVNLYSQAHKHSLEV